jgi:hypothetical protein
LSTWADVKAFLLTFDRAGLQGLVQDLYAASKDNQAFLHVRFGLGPDQLGPYKATISRWINPDLMKNQTVSVSKAKKAIADYNKAIGRPEGLAELSIFYCEEAFSFVESCSFDDERYFIALIRMYDQSVNRILSLPLAERLAYVERLGKLRTRAKRVGWGVKDELNDLWHAADFEEQLEWITMLRAFRHLLRTQSVATIPARRHLQSPSRAARCYSRYLLSCWPPGLIQVCTGSRSWVPL